MNSIEMPLLKVPIISEAHAQARQFAAQQATPQKGKRVYLNTLAVYAIHNYLKWMGYETSLEQGDSWQPDWQFLCDVADLVIPRIGKLECRPVLPGETVISLPPEVTEDRIGYVAVKFGDRLDQVELLGFTPAVDAEDAPVLLRIADIQPLEALLDRLESLEASAIETSTNAPSLQSVETQTARVSKVVVTPSQPSVNLGQWLQNNFTEAVEAGWRTIETLLATEQRELAFSLRSASQFKAASAKRAKLINLGNQAVALLVALTLDTEQKLTILVQVHPILGEKYLPPNLTLALLSDSGEILQEALARNQDNYIQLKRFRLLDGGFTIRVSLGDIYQTEDLAVAPTIGEMP